MKYLILFLLLLPSALALDMKYANVVDVKTNKVSNGYDFSVTLQHDDDGEGGYADSWQVETIDGILLGRRVLTHAHGNEPFTRNQIIPVEVEEVIILGHDQTHGFGGQKGHLNMLTHELTFFEGDFTTTQISTTTFKSTTSTINEVTTTIKLLTTTSTSSTTKATTTTTIQEEKSFWQRFFKLLTGWF